jgi:hypothetical protein
MIKGSEPCREFICSGWSRRKLTVCATAGVLLVAAAPVLFSWGAAPIASSLGTAAAQYISADTYTRYELLGPESHQFKIYYEVTQTRPGARFYFNPIREGSEASDESVIDPATGKPLKFEVVSGSQAKSDEPGENFSPAGKYIKIYLAHAVPAAGEYRLIIIKTYKDEKSYYQEGDLIVFKRSLTIPRNSVVLPSGFEVVSSSISTQVVPESDGRLKLAFVNPGSGGPLEVTIKARKLSRGQMKASN